MKVQKAVLVVTSALAIGGAIVALEASRSAPPPVTIAAKEGVRTLAAVPAPSQTAPAAVTQASTPLVAKPVAPAKAAKKLVEPKQATPESTEARAEAGERAQGPVARRFREEAESTAVGTRREGERDRWYQWFYGQRSYPSATIPANARGKALAAAKKNNHAKGARLAPLGSATLWTPVGPGTIPLGQTDTCSSIDQQTGRCTGPLTNVSGRVSAIAVDPTDTNVIYAGGAQGGVWKSTDAGATWTAMTDHEASLAMGYIAIDPNDHNTIYAGTGESNGSCDSYYGAGILKSTDGGNTWVTLNGDLNSTTGVPFYGQSISKIIINPQDSTMLWASTALSFISSGTEQCALGPVFRNGALWRSTDAGITWAFQDVPTGTSPDFTVSGNNRMHDMVLDPTDPSVLYVAVRNNGIWKSTNANDTSNPPAFTRLGGGLPPINGTAQVPTNGPIRRVTLGIGSGAGHNTLYAAFEDGVTSDLWGLFKSTDAGATWFHIDNGVNGVASVEANINLNRTQGPSIPQSAVGHRIIIFDDNETTDRTVVAVLSNGNKITISGTALHGKHVPYTIGFYPLFCDSQCFYDMTIGVDPTDSTGNTVYIGGSPNAYNLDQSAPGPGYPHYMWKGTSSDGTTYDWASVSQGDATAGGIHTDDHVITFAGGNMYDGNDGGIWRSSDGGGTWTDLNTNLAITQFQGVSQHPTDATKLLGGTQDNGTNILNSDLATPPAWFHTDFGDGGQSIIDSHDANRMLHTYFNVPGFYGPSQVTDGGVNGPGTWSFVGTYYGYGPEFYNGMNPLDPVSFYIPLVQHPAYTPNVTYIGSNHLYRTQDPKPACCDAWGTGLATACGFGTVLVCPNAPSWTPVSPDLTHGGGAYLSAIGVYPFVVGGKEIVYTGALDGAINVTSNLDASATATWTEIDNSTTPPRFITDIAVDPADATGSTAYATFSGFGFSTPTTPGHVFVTTNGLSGSATWTDISGDLPDIPVNAIALTPHDGTFVGTDIGVFQTTDGGSTWALLDSGHPYVAVFGLKYNKNNGQLVSSTHGRGMFTMPLATGCKQGDVNGDGNVDVADVFYLINYLFASGPAPTCTGSGNVNGDLSTDIADVFYLINFLFAGGPNPI